MTDEQVLLVFIGCLALFAELLALGSIMHKFYTYHKNKDKNGK